LSDSGQNQATISSYDVADALGRLEQIFGRAYRLLSFEDGYDELPEDPSTMSFAEGEKHGKFTQLNQNQWDDWDEWDSLVNGDSVEAPQAPVIRSVGMCSGVECYEGSAGTFSINSYANGELLGGGSMLASASFFAYADSNQMPLRRVIMDWGDDFDGAETVDNDVWPTGRQSGSDADDNFYKNHRGLDSAGEEVCSSQASEFGKTPEACATGYINFTHNYVCSQGDVESLEATNRECIVDDETGRLVNPPCTGGDVGADAVGACVFQPRAHAMDNWGWCTGYCDNGATDPSGNDGCWGEGECNVIRCPGNAACIDTYGFDKFDNPWINWDGYIILRPE
jgi:hypothetical protein